MALLLFIILLSGTVWLHSRSFVRQMKEDLSLVIEMDFGVSSEQVEEVTTALHKMPETISDSYQFLSKEDAFENMIKEYGDDFLSEEFPNPLKDMITISIKEEFMNQADVSRIKKQIADMSEEIDGVYFEDSVLKGSLNNVERVGWIVLIISLVLFSVVFTLLYNTVRLSLFSNRFLVKNMELVGAKTGFIMRPFVFRSAVHGLLASLLAVLLLGALGYYLHTNYPSLLQMTDWKWFLVLVLGNTVLGVLLSSFSTAYTVLRYLKTDHTDLF